jgi:tetratricopeptide (TPR) repeat protein
MRRELLIGFLLVAAVTAVYWPVRSYPFVLLDDYGYVVENPNVRPGLTYDGVVYAFTGVTVGNWHPLTLLSHMLDCELFGVEKGAGWHHAVNVALHAANTLLLFIVLRLMTGTVWRSALVAALFGLHPLHVESVAWISERKDVLSTLFFMLMLLAYYHYVRRPTFLRYAAVFAWLALGLMSKPMLVTAPFVLLLLDYWPLGRMRASTPHAEHEEHGEDCEPLSRLIVEKIPLLVLVAASAVLTYLVQRNSGAMSMLGQEASLWTRLGNALYSYGEYLEKSFWPSPLAAIYPYVKRNPTDMVIRGLALGAISVAAVRLAKLRPFLLVGWCWYLGTLAPVIGLVQVGVQSMADRYTYIPLIGIFLIVTWGAAELSVDWPARNKGAAAAVLLALCGWCSRQQVETWSSSEALYGNAVKIERYNIFAMHGLGMVYWEEGKLDKAEETFEEILKIKSDPTVHVAGGFEMVHRDLGLLLAVRHQPRKALEQLDAAIQDRAQQPQPYRHKAWILATYRDPLSRDGEIRDGKNAVKFAETALQLSSGKQPEYWDTLAAAQAEAGNFKEAVAAGEKALEQARALRADDLVAGIQQRLELYKKGIPYHAAAQRPLRD